MDLIDMRVRLQQAYIRSSGQVVDRCITHLLFDASQHRSGQHDIADTGKADDKDLGHWLPLVYKMTKMLGLKLPTDPRWVNLAEMSPEEVLTDHAYCEQKAASTCISLIQQYPEREELVEQLAPVVTEEWGHFRMVMKELKKKN